MRTDPQKRTDFLARLATMPEPSQRHLLNIEIVAELRLLQTEATGTTKEILDGMLGGLDSKHDQLVRRLGFEAALAREIFDPKVSDAEYFKRRRDYHEIR